MASFPPALSASYKESFAYKTIKDRVPIIVTRIVDHLYRQKTNIFNIYGEDGSIDCKKIVGKLSQLKNEIQTNKPLKKISVSVNKCRDVWNDDDIWNEEIDAYKEVYNDDPKWFEVAWLFAECYCYKRIHSIFQSSKVMKMYDPFQDQKRRATKNSLETIKNLCQFLKEFDFNQKSNLKNSNNVKLLNKIIQMSLWGNQYDLSISAGAEIESNEENFLSRLDELEQNIVVSNEDSFWRSLAAAPSHERVLGIILDNAGVEFVSDLCLAVAVTRLGLASKVLIFPKTRPWFVSDVTMPDFTWTMQFLKDEGGDTLQLSETVATYLESGVWEVRERMFWTAPQSFAGMPKVDPDLYQELQECKLILIKGDLNYRKAMGDLDWSPWTPVRTALRGFVPADLMFIRTIKGGPVAGLEPSKRVRAVMGQSDWNTSGKIGLIQFVPKSESWIVKAKKFSPWLLFALAVGTISIMLKRVYKSF